MKTFDRYIGRQVLSSTTFAVVVLSFVLVLGNIFKELLEELVKRPDMDAKYVFQFILNVLPFSLIFTIPWGFLTAVLLVFGRMSADNELISIRMAGLSLTRICAPVFALAILLTAASLWLNVSVAPQAKKNLRGMVLKMAIEDPTALFSSDEVITEIPGYVIYVEEKLYAENKGDTQLKNLQLIELNKMNKPIRYVKAERVTMRTEEDDGELVIVLDLERAHIENKDSDDPANFEEINLGYADSTPLVISLEKLRDKHSRVNPGIMTVSEIRGKLTDPGLEPALQTSLRSEISKRYSFSMACVTFGLIGIPLGVTAQRRETSIGFALSLIIASVYFLFIILADTFREDAKAFPHLLMWLPNIVFVGLGLMLYRRLSRR